eukprot:5687327-Prymnesium_polylepis.1
MSRARAMRGHVPGRREVTCQGEERSRARARRGRAPGRGEVTASRVRMAPRRASLTRRRSPWPS